MSDEPSDGGTTAADESDGASPAPASTGNDTEDGDTTGEAETLECFDPEDVPWVAFSLYDQGHRTLSCTPTPSLVHEGPSGRLETRINLRCRDSDAPAESPDQGHTLTIEAVALDLGTEPVELEYHYELGLNHTSGFEAWHELSIEREGRTLVYAAWDEPRPLDRIGGEYVRGDDCWLTTGFGDFQCGQAYGVRGVDPDGVPVVGMGGAPVILAKGDESFLVSVWGGRPPEALVPPEHCDSPHYESAARGWAAAVATELLLDE